MTKPNFTLAYSPCPNDTFLFYHLIHSHLTSEFTIQEELKDVEELNQSAAIGKYDITKLSFAAYFALADKYELLEVGSALGRNCGPMLIYSREIFKDNSIPSKLSFFRSILSPGEHTTANLLLRLYANEKEITPVPPHKLPLTYMRYDRIIPGLQNREGDLGLIIHEERFTYQAQGMNKWIDLGEWWEKTTGHPIPLGCIAIRKDLAEEWKTKVENALRTSLELAWKDPSVPQEYILENSQNKDPEVVQSHINLYVNRFTMNLGDEGKSAIQELHSRYLLAKE